MLILNRTPGQAINLAEGLIKITILEVTHSRKHGFRVRVGIDAPKDIPIHRDEVERIEHAIAEQLK